MNKPIKNILVFNVNWIGDVVFSTPIFKALKEHYPEARISCLAVPRVKEILECCPGLDEIMIFDEKRRGFSLRNMLRVIFEIRRRNFDMAFILHRSWTRALLVWLAGVPQRIGHPTKHRGLFLTHRVSPLSGQCHRSDYYLHILEDFGVPVRDRGYELSVPPEARDSVRKMLAARGLGEKNPFIVIHPGGNWDLKRWKKDNFAQVIERINHELHIPVVLSGAQKDLALARDVAELSGVSPVVLTGQTSLKQAAALMSFASLVISSDSGPLHIAHSVGTPVVGIFGATLPEQTGPRGKSWSSVLRKDVGCNEQSCYALDCPENICMQAVSVDDVMTEVHKFFAKGSHEFKQD